MDMTIRNEWERPIVDELTYRSYATQRHIGASAELCAKHFPSAALLEARYQVQGVPAKPVDSKEEALRERFEAWAKEQGWSLEKTVGDGYACDATWGAWHALKAFL